VTRLRLLLAAYVAVLVATDIGFSIRLGTPAGARVHNPVHGLEYPRLITVEGDAWSRDGVERVEVVAVHANGGTTTVEAERASIRYRGTPVRPLAAWSARLELPFDGVWKVGARATLAGGGAVEARTRSAGVSERAAGRAFVHFSAQHLLSVAAVAAACVAVALWFRVPRSERGISAAGAGVAAVLWINEYAYHWYWFSIGAFAVTNNLMLHMCGLAILMIPFLFTMAAGKGRQVLFEILYFWGLGGAVQALLAPDIGQHGFPEFKAFAFFVSHGLICVAAVYMIAARKMTLTFGSYLRGLAFTNAAALIVYFLNLVAAVVPPYEAANYFMIGYPPPTGSVIDAFADLFGPSPRYAIGLEAMALVVFLLIYLPFPIGRALRHAGGREEARSGGRGDGNSGC
jgi:hypothetical integral membrane protein (TIGR02206 family)